MSLADAFTPGDAKRAKKVPAAADIPRMSVVDAMHRLHAATHAHDVPGMADAFRHACAAYDDEIEPGSEG